MRIRSEWVKKAVTKAKWPKRPTSKGIMSTLEDYLPGGKMTLYARVIQEGYLHRGDNLQGLLQKISGMLADTSMSPIENTTNFQSWWYNRRDELPSVRVSAENIVRLHLEREEYGPYGHHTLSQEEFEEMFQGELPLGLSEPVYTQEKEAIFLPNMLQRNGANGWDFRGEWFPETWMLPPVKLVGTIRAELKPRETGGGNVLTGEYVGYMSFDLGYVKIDEATFAFRSDRVTLGRKTI